MKVWELLIVYVVLTVPTGAWLWPYTINSWLVYAGKEPTFDWWMGGLLGLVPAVGQLWLLGAPATWITMLFI